MRQALVDDTGLGSLFKVIGIEVSSCSQHAIVDGQIVFLAARDKQFDVIIANPHLCFLNGHRTNTLDVLNITLLNSLSIGNIQLQLAALVHALPCHDGLAGIDSYNLAGVKMEGFVETTLKTA